MITDIVEGWKELLRLLGMCQDYLEDVFRKTLLMCQISEDFFINNVVSHVWLVRRVILDEDAQTIR